MSRCLPHIVPCLQVTSMASPRHTHTHTGSVSVRTHIILHLSVSEPLISTSVTFSLSFFLSLLLCLSLSHCLSPYLYLYISVYLSLFFFLIFLLSLASTFFFFLSFSYFIIQPFDIGRVSFMEILYCSVFSA